jgi:hypothetical protein
MAGQAAAPSPLALHARKASTVEDDDDEDDDDDDEE